MNAPRVNRFDVSEIGKPTRTPQGFLKVPGFPTSAGVFPYRRADGSTVLELRPPEEVFKADSLATLAGATVTNLHPTEPVTPKNVRALQIGIVGESVRQDGNKVAAHITVQDGDVIAMVDRRDRCELSSGYQCRLDETPGVWNGQRYDAVQRDIVYNHVALGPKGWGRQGSEVALRLDSGDATTFHAPSDRREDNADPAGGQHMDLVTIRIDSVDVQVQKAMQSYVETALKKRDDSIVSLTAARDTLQGKLDANTTEITDLKKKLDDANDTKRLDALVAARSTLLTAAARVLPADFKYDGLKPRDVHEAVIKKIDDKFDATGKSDDYVLSRFDSEIAKLPAGDGKGNGGTGRSDSLGAARGAMSPHGNGGGNNQARSDQAPAPYTPPWMRPLSTTSK